METYCTRAFVKHRVDYRSRFFGASADSMNSRKSCSTTGEIGLFPQRALKRARTSALIDTVMRSLASRSSTFSRILRALITMNTLRHFCLSAQYDYK
jgi:hypothetical protein